MDNSTIIILFLSAFVLSLFIQKLTHDYINYKEDNNK